jgi:maltose alpha-D-glucosyltransferase/alpha-amylase
MRLNLGIRRRLAPLLENSRRRIELLTSMLFAFPGTPIIYYGDEIGMGDNIYLGDRNGVRTPMQWSSDRNGGFSRVDPARLYAPLIMDPVYGYQAINVEAQERYPFSLLNWMKRVIAMRKQHRVFGRGTLDFVACPNRRILAFLRRDDRETVLIVVNLARAVQPAELDLRAFAGLIPVEMWGLTEFPRIGEQPYLLTLGPYASYWFSLQQQPMQMAAKVAAPVDAVTTVAATLPSLLVGVDWQTVLDISTRNVLERQALRPFLQRQRWFGAKARDIRHVRFSDWARIHGGANPAFLSTVSVTYDDASVETYLVPLALVSGADADRVLAHVPERVLARITGARKGAIVDGMEDDGTCDRLLWMVIRDEQIATTRGIVRGTRTVQPDQDASEPFELTPERRWTRGAGDQSNTVAFVDDRYVLKLFRKIEAGPNPEYEMERMLTERQFTRIPRLIGAVEYTWPEQEAGTLAVIQTLVKHQGSGWEYTINELGRYYERVSTRTPAKKESRQLEPPPFFLAIQRWYLRSAAVLGRRTAEMHLALGDAQGSPFAAEPLHARLLEDVAEGMRAHAREALALLESRRDTLDDPERSQVDRLLGARASLIAKFDEIRQLPDGGARIRIHGDYHLGQVLRTEEDFVILDFEGEPARPLVERRAKHSPLKDIAGMLRSFSYAAYAALFAFTVHAPDDFSVLEPWAAAWQHWIGEAFLRDYRETMALNRLVPDGESFTVLLRALLLDKALYELGYELNNRPEWLRIPLTGLLKMLEAPGRPPAR